MTLIHFHNNLKATLFLSSSQGKAFITFKLIRIFAKVKQSCLCTTRELRVMAGLINFEDENEVKQFLDNLGLEYSYQCHKEKDPEGKNSLLCWNTNPDLFVCAIVSCVSLSFKLFRVPKARRLFGRGEEKLRLCSTNSQTQL